MRIRDSYSDFYSSGNGKEVEYEFKHGSIKIYSDDGESLYELKLFDDGSLEVRACMTCNLGDRLLSEKIMVQPVSSDIINITRIEVKK